MATHPDLTDMCDDIDFMLHPNRLTARHSTADLGHKVQSLQAEVDMLQQCLHDSLDLQRNILEQWTQQKRPVPKVPAAQITHTFPQASSTPYVPGLPTRETEQSISAPGPTQPARALSQSQSDSLELINTTRVLAAALHQAKLEPTVFANDGSLHPEEWLQSVNAYKTSLDLTDAQILRELPHFLAKEPRKWFNVLIPHVSTWAKFCELFRTVFLPADNQEQILRGILDRFQHPEEPLPTFVAHMLSEFRRLRNPPSEQEQIELICKHAVEKYRVALYGTPVRSVIDLVLRAHELHSVLGTSLSQSSRVQLKNRAEGGPRCFKCAMPGVTSRTCPNCSTDFQGARHSPRTAPEPPQSLPPDHHPVTQPADPDETGIVRETRPAGRRQGNFRGGRVFHRGNPPPSQ